MKSATIILASTFSIFAASQTQSNLPPANIPADKAPLFIFIGSDDNYGNGMPLFLDYLENKENPAGTGQSGTFDSAPVRMSFYSNTCYQNVTWMEWHQRALDDGHELGLHTHGHPHVSSTELAISEIQKNRDLMGQGVDFWNENPISFPEEVFTGFRAPYLDVNNHVFTALEELGLRYDCSLEDGMAPDVEVEDFNWPYTLDDPANPGWKYLYEHGKADATTGVIRDTAESHPGIWEIPATPLFFIPDSLYEEYGVGVGYDDATPWVDPGHFGEINESEDGRKMTGLDYDAWYVQNWSGHELAMTLLYNLKLHLESNRAPLSFGVHSNYYTEGDRFEGFKTFVDTALTFDDVRFVTGNDLINWMENPVALAGYQTPIEEISTIESKVNKLSISGSNSAIVIDAGEQSGRYELVSISGRSIRSGDFSHSVSIEYNSLSRGVYLVKVTSGEYETTQRFIFQ